MDIQGAATGEAPAAAASYREFFTELRQGFVERETVISQLELALLAREHLLIVGPPGTGKSALAGSALERIVDREGGVASLFSKQLTESTVQTDLIGPVDFKVLTETGRTEYLTDDGMLGATHAFLDEVFDGRDMLLRSILNVLHERELKHGRRVTPGRIECAVLTSNRYLSEVVERSPELLVAFADRIAFASFVPKSFAQPQSRAAMLKRALAGQRPVLSRRLLIEELDLLQDAVGRVEVPAEVAEALELLNDGLEQRLFEQVANVPGYQPTKIFSQRSLVKAQGVLRAAVIRDWIWRDPGRPHVATLGDLASLRLYLTLGGPETAALGALLARVVDPRERAQLEIVRLESESFTAALADALAAVVRSAERESQALGTVGLLATAESLQGSFDVRVAQTLLERLCAGLTPGPRHPENRAHLVTVARAALLAVQHQLARGPGIEVARGSSPAAAVAGAVELVRTVPELAPAVEAFVAAAEEFVVIGGSLAVAHAEAAALEEGLGLVQLTELVQRLSRELAELSSLSGRLRFLGAKGDDGDGLADVRGRVGAALRRCTIAAFQGGDGREATLEARSLALTRLAPLLAEVDPTLIGLRETLLEPLARAWALRTLASARFDRVEALTTVVRQALGAYGREGISPALLLGEAAPILRERLEAHAAGLEARGEAGESPIIRNLFTGDTYQDYRQRLSSPALDGESVALQNLEGMLRETGLEAEGVVSASVREAVARAELASVESRATYLVAWFARLVEALPATEDHAAPGVAAKALDQLVKSHFPLLALREGELLRLSTGASRLAASGSPMAPRAQELAASLERLEREFGVLGRSLLESRGAG